MKSGWIAAVILVLAACSGAERSDLEAVGDSEQVTIYRDHYGTPQVVAESNRGVYFGFGYAVATDRLFQMDMLRRTAEGRVAEVLGTEFLDLDIHVRTTYDHPSVARQLAELPASQRLILQAYADGFNRRIGQVLADRSTLMPAEFSDYDFEPELWSAYDVAMIFVGSIAHRYSDFNSERDNLHFLQQLEQQHGKDKAWRIFNASKWLLDADSPTTVPRAATPSAIPSLSRPDYLDALPRTGDSARIALASNGRFRGLTSDPDLARGHKLQLARWGFSNSPEYTGASNYWAARELSDADGALVNGPQFGFGVPSYVYGIGLHGGDFNAVGNTLLGLPTLLFAHNDHIAWGSTAGISDQSDEFLLALNKQDYEQYRHNNDWLAFESWTETIQVKGEKPTVVTARRSTHGMVMDYQPQADVAWVRARAWEGQELATLMAWVFLATDHTLDSAQQRIGQMATNINMYTMDSSGNLSYVHSGRYPQRSQGHDPRLPLPGDGNWDWRGLRPYSDNPTVTNPPLNYIANWNNRPRADWISSDLWTYTWGRGDRARLLFDHLEDSAGASVAAINDINRDITFADVTAPFLLPHLKQAWRGQPIPASADLALAALDSWDGQWQVDENGDYGPMPALMETWLRGLLKATFKDDVGSDSFHLFAATNYPNSPLGASMGTSPGAKALIRNLDKLASGSWANGDYDFFNGVDPSQVLRDSLVAALDALAGQQGSEMKQWRLKPEPMIWQPFNFRGVPQSRPASVYRLPAYMNRGSENNLFVARNGVIEARDVIPPGQSGFIAPDGTVDVHGTDQMEPYADFSYKSVPFTLELVKAAATSEVRLQISP